MNMPAHPVGLHNTQDWNAFVKFTENRGDGTVVGLGLESTDKNEPLQLFPSQRDSAWKLWRSSSLKKSNETVRESFKTAVFRLFNLDSTSKGDVFRLPAGVRKAMRLGDSGSGKPITVRQIKSVKAAIEKWQADAGEQHLALCQQRIDRIVTDVNAYGTALGNVGGAKPGVYSLNGKPLEVPDDKNHFLDKNLGAMKNANDERELKLRKALVAFCNDDVLPYSASNPLCVGGRIANCRPEDIRNTVTITKSWRGGYDIVVKQKFSNVTELSDPQKMKEKKLFSLKNPPSYEVTCKYRLELKGGHPVVSLRKNPVVESRNGYEVGRRVFARQLEENIETVWKAGMRIAPEKFQEVDTRMHEMSPDEYFDERQRFIREYIDERGTRGGDAYEGLARMLIEKYGGGGN